MFETVCIWLVCRVDILGVGIPLFLSRWIFLGGGGGGGGVVCLLVHLVCLGVM
jgi:hypothetical protein